MMDKEYLVVIPIEPMLRGASFKRRESLPLHCTLMPWFRLKDEVDLNHLTSKLATLTREHSIELVSKRRAFFGPKNNTSVHILQRNDALNLLHTKLLIFLAERKAGLIGIEFVGAGYRPHVTDRKRISFPPETRHVAKYLVLMERDKRIKTVVDTYQLGEISM